MTSRPIWRILLVLPLLLTCGCVSMETGAADAGPVHAVATSGHRWTGVACSSTGRIFVSWPRWSRELPLSVAEYDPATDRFVPFPDEAWNSWDPGAAPGDAFVCVQALWVDDEDVLWVLDPASPMLAGVVPGGAKLVSFDLKDDDRLIDAIAFDAEVAPPASYLNDVRIDTLNRHAYITDSGLGALIVVDLDRESARRVLEGDVSTRSEGVVPVVKGERWTSASGSDPHIHADGIALSPGGTDLYWHALTGTTLWRLPARKLRDTSMPDAALAAEVEAVARTGPCDGMIFLPDGRLVFTDLENDALGVWSVRDGVTRLLADPDLVWPDSLALTPDGDLLLTTSRLNEWDRSDGAFGLHRIEVAPAASRPAPTDAR